MGKTFICYSHQDKERFVQGFYKRLLELGVDVSIDELDIIPGDNFPRKIFEECIDNCENFIIILSKNSINSEWVNEELDAGMVQKIEKGARLIPIIIDDLNIDEVPNRLRHITHHSVNDISNYDTDAKRIANICLGLYEKPEVKPPKVNKSKAGNYPSLSKMDAFVFDTLVDIAMQDDEEYIGVDTLLEKLSGILSYDEIEESLEVLKSTIYINIYRVVYRRNVYAV